MIMKLDGKHVSHPLITSSWLINYPPLCHSVIVSCYSDLIYFCVLFFFLCFSSLVLCCCCVLSCVVLSCVFFFSLSCFVLTWLALSCCLVLSCLVLFFSCLILSCLVLSFLSLSFLSFPFFSCFVLSCSVLSCLVFFVLSCLIFYFSLFCVLIAYGVLFQRTFHYRSGYWTHRNTYNPRAAAGGLNTHETKLATYHLFPFSSLCVGMRVGKSLRWLRIPYRASSLFALIADNKHRHTRLGRNAWKSLIPGSSLQRNCNMEGFNVNFQGRLERSEARIGIISNQENNCHSPDSRIAFGGGGGYCSQNDNHSVGNEARCNPDNGDRSTVGFGYIMAQWKASQRNKIETVLGNAASSQNCGTKCSRIESTKDFFQWQAT